jgi:hypothetical protein
LTRTYLQVVARKTLSSARTGEFVCHKVSTRANRVANDDAQLILPITAEERETEAGKPAKKAGPGKPASVAPDDGQGSLF